MISIFLECSVKAVILARFGQLVATLCYDKASGDKSEVFDELLADEQLCSNDWNLLDALWREINAAMYDFLR